MPELPQTLSEDAVDRVKAGWNRHPLHAYFGITLEELGDGYARCRMRSNEHNRGGVHGAAHGGVLAFLSDAIALAAIHTALEPEDVAAGTAELNISYLRPAVDTVVAEARLLRKGRTLAVVDIDLRGDDDKLLAKSRVSYALHPRAMIDGRGAISGDGQRGEW